MRSDAPRIRILRGSRHQNALAIVHKKWSVAQLDLFEEAKILLSRKRGSARSAAG